jgi:prophage regulatory protein
MGWLKMNEQSNGRLLRLPSVKTQTGLSKSEIYRRIKLGTFPKPLSLGARAVAWTAASVEGWIAALVQQSAK